jgi:hydrogenase nickel incorporation protein HypA/HybF
MHELSLCEGILQVLGDQASEQYYARMTMVSLEIGTPAAVEVEAMRFGFDPFAAFMGCTVH